MVVSRRKRNPARFMKWTAASRVVLAAEAFRRACSSGGRLRMRRSGMAQDSVMISLCNHAFLSGRAKIWRLFSRFLTESAGSRDDPGKPVNPVHFPLAKEVAVPSLPAPCQESQENRRHGKPLPNVSRSLVQGKCSVADRVPVTCFNARTASASAGSDRRLSSPPLT